MTDTPTPPAPVGFTDPMGFIAAQLAAHAQGQQVDEDAMQEAITLVAAAQFVRAGMSMDAVERLFTERDHHFRVAFEPDDDGEECLTVEVIWDDDEATTP